MFKVILLVCAAGIAPRDCQFNNAIDVISGPDAGNEIACGLQSQAYFAGTALGRSLREDEYLKIVCRRTGIGRDRVG